MYLIIVESPTKAKTISKFLEKNYNVISSFGHIRDLPKGELGVDTKKNFEPKYVIPTKARKAVSQLKKSAKQADLIILATDEDREGEAIAWHILHILNQDKKKQYQRIAFHEITKTAIEKALKNPREINIDLVDAQQTRRILDRLVGYKLSPFLWKKVVKGLSAGRVQSVAVRLIVDREREREKFKPEEYWTVTAQLKKKNEKKSDFLAKLFKENNKTIPKLGIKNKEASEKILENLKSADYKIKDIESKTIQRNPLPPFTTSVLQQEAARKFGFSSKQTMRLAQQLYEAGLITYHRTDSLNLSQQAIIQARDFIQKEFKNKYLPQKANFYKTKSKGAQEAHEAIRPTRVSKKPSGIRLDPRQSKLYEFIWRRFVACQMAPALIDTLAVDVEAGKYVFRANGSSVKFDGFLKIYPVKLTENILPKLSKSEILDLVKLIPEQHFTQPPARYTEASLIKILEEYGIGRPSTYAPIISTIQERNYTQKDEQKRFFPTEMGFIVIDLLKKHFPKIVDTEFTANMEKDLDKIALGKKDKIKTLKEFYKPFEENLSKKYKQVEKKNLETPTDKKCPKCKGDIVIKMGRFGKFYACSNFPECKHTEPIIISTGVKCPECQKGNIIERKTRKGKTFYGCSKYPKCKFALWDKPTGETCPKCKSLLVEKGNKIKCSKKECGYKKK